MVSRPAQGDRAEEQVIESWLAVVTAKCSDKDRSLLRSACALAARVHAGESQDSGESTLQYLLSVAEILAGLGLDCETLAAAILHDVLSAQEIDTALLLERFGENVAAMVERMARIGLVAGIQRNAGRDDEESHTENLRRMLLSIADDVRVVLIMLAERLHDMRTLKRMPEDVRRRVAREVHDIYAPLANRLGVWQIKWELEDLSLRYLHSDTYQEIAGYLDERRQDREEFIANVISLLQTKLQSLGIEAEISGRPKHIYSIWRKMERKGVDIDQIFDLRAVRILVESVADCYAALGVVHGLWRHIPGEFDDYIATPKANLYQSLHTAVIGPGDKTLEVQIRTRKMHEHAERGVAAHWSYKEGRRQDSEFERRIMLMRSWLEQKEEGGGSGEFFDHSRAEFESRQIYVLTPQGKVIELPRGATPVDFSFAIHTDVGYRCRGAKVDGSIVPLTHQLESGHTVEIITTREGGPSRDWLSPHHGYIRTARARNRVRQWFRQQNYDQHVQGGRLGLEREFNRLGIGWPNLEQLVGRFNLRKVDDLLAAVGRGDISPLQVAGATGERKPAAPGKRRAPGHKGRERGRSEVIVEGVGDLMTHMARCCKPVPYDPIIGYITQGRGVTIHRQDCAMVRREGSQERLVHVVWSDQQAGASYPVDVRVMAQDCKGLLRDISSVFTNDEVNVVGVTARSDQKTDLVSMRFTVEIADIKQLSRVLNKVAQMPGVFEVRRQV